MKKHEDPDPLDDEIKRYRIIVSSIATIIILAIAIFTGSPWTYVIAGVSLVILLTAIFSKVKDSDRM